MSDLRGGVFLWPLPAGDYTRAPDGGEHPAIATRRVRPRWVRPAATGPGLWLQAAGRSLCGSGREARHSSVCPSGREGGVERAGRVGCW